MIKIISEKEPDLAAEYLTKLNRTTNIAKDKNSDVLYISLRKLLKDKNFSKSDLIVGFKMYLDENYTDVQIIDDLTMRINHMLSSEHKLYIKHILNNEFESVPTDVLTKMCYSISYLISKLDKDKKCGNCSKLNCNKICSCKYQHYCSVECQKTHWKIHKVCCLIHIDKKTIK
jgi:hypothetical protein